VRGALLLLAVAVAMPADARRLARLPADVRAFRADRDSCDHWRGEDGYDKARAAEIARAVRESCTGTDARLTRLRAKYRGNAAVVAALAGYEDTIE
jgi:hypothetical protein